MTSTHTTAEWDLPRLLKDLGGPQRVRALLFAHGMKPVLLRTLYAWSNGQAKGASSGFALLVALSRRIDPNFDPSKYLVTKEEPNV